MDATQNDRTLGAQVAEQIEAAPGAGFILVDGALCPMSRAPWLRHVPRIIVAPRSSPQASSDALPYLLEITAYVRALLKETVTLARESSGVTWLTSSLSGQDLAVALSLRTEAVLPQNLPVFLRVADARVLPVILAVLSEAQRKSFFNVASAWCYLDRQHELAQLQLPKFCEERFSPPLVLTEAQEQALLKAAEPDAVLRLLATNDHEALEGLPTNKRHAFVVQQMDRAVQWGLSEPVDIALYCSIALTHGHDFDLQPAWSAKLQGLKLGRLTVAQLIS